MWYIVLCTFATYDLTSSAWWRHVFDFCSLTVSWLWCLVYVCPVRVYIYIYIYIAFRRQRVGSNIWLPIIPSKSGRQNHDLVSLVFNQIKTKKLLPTPPLYVPTVWFSLQPSLYFLSFLDLLYDDDALFFFVLFFFFEFNVIF